MLQLFSKEQVTNYKLYQVKNIFVHFQLNQGLKDLSVCNLLV